jgi:peptide deformylase
MAVLEIAKIGDPILRQRAAEVDPAGITGAAVRGLIDDVVDTMRAAAGAGLAAIQVRRPVRVVAVEVTENPRYPYKPAIPLTVVVNPVVTPLTDATFESYEGCLSVPDLRGLVRRVRRVRVTGWDRGGAPLDFVAEGLAAGTWQHEVDHLDGVLFVDRVADTRTLATWREWERHHKERWLASVADLVRSPGAKDYAG